MFCSQVWEDLSQLQFCNEKGGIQLKCQKWFWQFIPALICFCHCFLTSHIHLSAFRHPHSSPGPCPSEELDLCRSVMQPRSGKVSWDGLEWEVMRVKKGVRARNILLCTHTLIKTNRSFHSLIFICGHIKISALKLLCPMASSPVVTVAASNQPR